MYNKTKIPSVTTEKSEGNLKKSDRFWICEKKLKTLKILIAYFKKILLKYSEP